jgi:hypothetical protein
MWTSVCPVWLQLLLGAVEGLIFANFYITQTRAHRQQEQECGDGSWYVAVLEDEVRAWKERLTTLNVKEAM